MTDEERTSKFLKSIHIEDNNNLGLTLTSIVKSNYDANFYNMSLVKETPWTYTELDEFQHGLSTITTYKYEIHYFYKKQITKEELEALIKEYLFSKTYKELGYSISFNDTNILLTFNDNKEYNSTLNILKDLTLLFKEVQLGYEVNSILKGYELDDAEENNNEITGDFDEKMPQPEEEEEEVKSKLDIEFDENKIDAEKAALENYKKNYDLMVSERRNKELFKKGEYTYSKIKDLTDNSGAIDINGKVFQLDVRNTRKGKKVARVGVMDEESAINVTMFCGRTISDERLDEISVGKNIRVEGRVDMDKFGKGLYVMCHNFQLLPDDEPRKDEAEVKRVELHLHTNMSEMDGLPSIEAYCKLAKAMGHNTLAITDHGVVQAFPLAQDCVKKYKMKILYGSEIYMLDDYLKGCLNPANIDLKKTSYVVFDLESTGLNIRYDHITEIGAVRIENGSVIEHYHTLVNPGCSIPKIIQEKTNITDAMVKDKPFIKDVIEEFLAFCKDSIIISHNIEFDYGLLNEEMVNNGFNELNFPAIDTLQLSRFLYPERAKHSLGALCKRLEIDYETDDVDDKDDDDTVNLDTGLSTRHAHSGDYDAEVLAKCWLAILPKLYSKEVISKILHLNENECDVSKNMALLHANLEKLDIPIEYIKHWNKGGYHVCVIAKDQKGIKDLYKMISFSQIDYLGAHPFVPRHILQQYREHLIVGSACANGELFYCAFRRNEKALRNAMDFYDYVEIQPLENYSYLPNSGEVNSIEDVKRAIRDIIKVADEKGKMVVATGDCHYLNPEDKKYRDVFIESKGVGKVRHPLTHYRKKDADKPYYPNPDQHYRTTDEMLKCFEWLGKDKAYEYVVTNSNKIADSIPQLSAIPMKEGPFTPTIEGCEDKLKDLCFENARKLYGDKLPEYIETRLTKELNGIIKGGYAVVYYISQKMVKMSMDKGYIIGSRGSVGSSFAATMAGITEVNPLKPHYRCPKCRHFELNEDEKYKSGFDLPTKKCPICGEEMIGDGQDIPFETFLGFNADKVPDIDLNFPADFQPEAHLFTKELLGEDKVFRAGTISTVQQKTAFGYIRELRNTGLYKHMTDIQIEALAYGCQEVKRTTGQHPGGIVVIPNEYDVYDFCPIQFPAGETDSVWKTTHFDFSSVHDTLLKFDMLGHLDPQAVKMMSDMSGFNYAKIKMNDKKVLSLFSNDTALNLQHKYMKPDNGALGLPEFGTKLTRAMLREVNPQTFADLMVISGLSHGTNVWGNNQEILFHDGTMSLDSVIGCRDDIMVYLMSKGISSHEAFQAMELVRKKGKHLTPELVKLMKDHGVPEYYIEACEKIEYLFPKGHACAYVMMACRVGYYKIYYPLEYYAAYFTIRCDSYDFEAMVGGIDKIYEKYQELKRRKDGKNSAEKLSNKEEDIYNNLEVALEMLERGYHFENIDINRSDASKFIVDKEHNSLLPPFKVLDGFGTAAGESVMKARKEAPFRSKKDLLERGGINKTNLADLKKLHVLDKLPDDDQCSIFDFSF